MRVSQLFVPLIASVALTGCLTSWSKPQPYPKVDDRILVLGRNLRPAESYGEPLDVLFVQVGTIVRQTPPFGDRATIGQAGRWSVYGALPDDLPVSKEYWLVFRCDQQVVPDIQTAAMLERKISSLLGQARKRHLNVVGVQLDIDSPTGALPQYAAYLREARKLLPSGFGVSITALLDWFRSGTAIGDVIREVDEFVPQFYDIDRDSYNRGTSIAARIDAARWGLVFNRFGKRFRVGISTFGRSRLVPNPAAATSGSYRSLTFRDLAPLDIATNSAFRLETARNPSSELVLSYRAIKKVRVSYTDFDTGDTVQFILATPEGVRTAVESARQMKGNLAGVVFFRWPGEAEALTMQPEEVMIAAGLAPKDPRVRNRIDVVDGRCAAVDCADLYLNSPAPFSPKPLRYRIRSSIELEYFLPEKNIPVRMANPSELEVSLPPYCARGRLYLGRAVTGRHSEFEVEAEP
jgi:hypothetical protein